MHYLLTITFLIFCQTTQAQQAEPLLPYQHLPEASETYTANTVAARMIDGLGFRYYWATEGLRAEDLSFTPSNQSRTTAETLDHIYGLCQMVLNAVQQQPNIRPAQQVKLTFEAQRAATLRMLKEASDLLREKDKVDLSNAQIIFQRGEQTSTFPFWNVLNGPLADAMWHVGQVVSFRRSSGNPIDSRVDVFSGKLRQ